MLLRQIFILVNGDKCWSVNLEIWFIEKEAVTSDGYSWLKIWRQSFKKVTRRCECRSLSKKSESIWPFNEWKNNYKQNPKCQKHCQDFEKKLFHFLVNFFDNLEINSKNFEHDVNTCLENKTKRFFKLDWNVEIKTGPIHLLP